MRLGHRDLAVLQRASLALHACRTEAELREAVHGIFLAAIPADYFQIVESQVSLETREARFLGCWESYDLTTPQIIERFQRVLIDHPFTRDGILSGRPDLVGRLSDYFSRRQFHNSRLYSELYRHVDVGDLMGTAFLHQGRHTAVSISRGARGRAFSDRDRMLFTLLRPHLELVRRFAKSEPASPHIPPCEYGLTPRESEVATWLAQGKANSEIAIILQMRVRTVEKHLERILVKLGVENRTAAALMLKDGAPGSP